MIAVTFLAASAGAQSAGHSNDVVMRAMRDELARSVAELRLDTLPKAYFIAYRITESQRTGAAARLGSLLGGSDESRSRFVSVEVRVGDYTFDNTNYFGAGFVPTAFVGFGSLPIEDSYAEIRRQLWLSTDRAYKQALEALSQKRAALETRTRPDDAPDFSREPAHTDVDEAGPSPFNRPDAEALVRSLSASFRAYPEIYNSRAGLSAGWTLTRYVNSEGTSFTRAAPRVSLTVTANTQAADGMPLSDSYEVSAASQGELPSRDSLTAAVRNVATRLTQLRQSPVAESYEGPVLFEGRAAAELFNAVIAPKLVGTRRPLAPAQFETMLSAMSNDWTDVLGSPVLPRLMSVVDDPTRRSMDGMIMEGYRVDDDGVPARANTVVERGVLKTLLTTRVPIPGVERSTGNRRGNGALPSTLIVTADSALSPDELRKKLLSLVEAQGLKYGIIVRRIANARSGGEFGSVAFVGMTGESGDGPRVQSLAAYRLYPDGREEMIRAPEISGISATSFKNIVAASRDRTVSSAAFSSRGGLFGGGSGNVTYVMPSLLFGNVTMRRPRGGNPRLPVVPPPEVR
jgi:hypothetical protein